MIQHIIQQLPDIWFVYSLWLVFYWVSLWEYTNKKCNKFTVYFFYIPQTYIVIPRHIKVLNFIGYLLTILDLVLLCVLFIIKHKNII